MSTTLASPPAPTKEDCDAQEPASPFERWVGNREVSHLGSNSGAEPLAFQRWHHFKEAFPPELIERMIEQEKARVESCLDVFGGSGTTALSCQLLGVSSTTIEINPFLADVIQTKVTKYAPDDLAVELDPLLERAKSKRPDPRKFFDQVPPTFIEPGLNGRWVFDAGVATRLAALLGSIEEIQSDEIQRFYRVIVGGILTEVSNVVINGKGRRYRRNWKERPRDASSVLKLFAARAQNAIDDVTGFADRSDVSAKVMLGDARETDPGKYHDLSVFSPPYPNSFDYTDIYNLELWMLGHLSDSAENRKLRRETLSSHVQLQREFARAPSGSKELDDTVGYLEEIREGLWNPWIPEMIGGYFADLMKVLGNVHHNLKEGRRCCIVVGDSRYGGVLVPTAKILADLSKSRGWTVRSSEPVRAMRSSAQHGGSTDLNETLLILVRESD
ncbi:MAG TPA: DNA methyltransferase [Solirubrobacterales bacterium]